MAILPASLAAINGVSVQNESFAVSAQVIAQKNVIIGTVDPAKESALTLNEPMRIFSPEQVGAVTGFGYMLHRLAKASFKGGASETWIIPQAESGDAAAANIAFGGAATQAREAALYIAFDRVSIPVSVGDSATNVADDFVVAINANNDLPVTASAAVSTLHLFSKSAGLNWGNDISLEFSVGNNEALPAGLTAVITDMSGGTGTPNIQPALDSLGTGDAQNEAAFTNMIHGYGDVDAVLNAISTYNGAGNEFVGNYRQEVARPFRSLIGDTQTGEYGLDYLLNYADTRKLDRTTGVIAAPGSLSHPQEIAAQAIGLIAVTNSIRAQEGYIDKPLIGVHIGDSADRWTNDYAQRDLAVRGGVGTTLVKSGNLTLQNVITFYRPDDVAPASNGYRAFRNISIIQNMLHNYRLNFERPKWKNITIVLDVSAVTDVDSRKKARDVDSVLDDLVALADEFASKGWLYTAEYTKSELQKGGQVVLRDGLTGFNINFPCIFSGEGGIYQSAIVFDTSIAILAEVA